MLQIGHLLDRETMDEEEIAETIREILPKVRELRTLPLWPYDRVLTHLYARLIQRDPDTLAVMAAILLMMLSETQVED